MPRKVKFYGFVVIATILIIAACLRNPTDGSLTVANAFEVGKVFGGLLLAGFGSIILKYAGKL